MRLLKVMVSVFLNFSLRLVFTALLMGFKLSGVLFNLSIFNNFESSKVLVTPVPP